MTLLHRPLFKLLCALFAFGIVAGDLAADSWHDAAGACVTESESSEHQDCAACNCCLHLGAVLDAAVTAALLPKQIATRLVDGATPVIPGLAAEIDHPPQLA